MRRDGGRLAGADERGVATVKLGVDMACIGDPSGSGDFGDFDDLVSSSLLSAFALGKDAKPPSRYSGAKSGWVEEVVERWACKRAASSCWILSCNCFVEARTSRFPFMQLRSPSGQTKAHPLRLPTKCQRRSLTRRLTV